MVDVSWQPFNERKPFGDGTVVGGDNIPHSQVRWEAIKAVKDRKATPEQLQLVMDTDSYIQDALSKRGG